MIKVLIYNEYVHEKVEGDRSHGVYPDGIHSCIADFLSKDGDIEVETTTLDDVAEVITPDKLKTVDVLMWWGHMRHGQVPDEVAKYVQEAVLGGMGAIFLHSAHASKPFMRLMGTPCNVVWRESGDLERVWIALPSHPIVKGLPRYFELEHEETYGEPFGIPNPDEQLLSGWFSGGETFRSGCVYRRGAGKVFYFQPGHETFPTYKDENVQKILVNAVRWAKPDYRIEKPFNSLHTPEVTHKG